MFQFPGFAFLTLCIQVKNTCFTALLADPKINNNTVSGGLPHSEIHGSKPILGSSWLIAEYHVFHRLLLPRHSPNALFALDLIQKKQDLLARHQKLVSNWRPYSEIKSILSRPLHVGEADNGRSFRNIRVSVLDLDNAVLFQQAYVILAEETAAKTLASDPKIIRTILRSSPYAA